MTTRNIIPDGLQEITDELPIIMKMIARTVRWTHPGVFEALPVWRPDIARTHHLYKADWVTPATNNGAAKFETNVAAQDSLMSALGVVGKKPTGWTTCHIWSYDDNDYVGRSRIVQDRRFYSCVGNMVLLPTPLKGFTDAMAEIKIHLRVCAFHLYGWACEHEDVADQAAVVRSGKIPEGYPEEWPTNDRHMLPPGVGPYNETIAKRIVERKKKIANFIETKEFLKYPTEEVREVLDFWKIDISEYFRNSVCST